MSGAPDFLTLKHDRDQACKREVPIRRTIMVLIALISVAGLLNVFGQRRETSKAAGRAASIKLYAPTGFVAACTTRHGSRSMRVRI